MFTRYWSLACELCLSSSILSATWCGMEYFVYFTDKKLRFGKNVTCTGLHSGK